MSRIKYIASILQKFTGSGRQSAWVKYIFLTYVFIAVFAPLIANHEPLIMKMNGHWLFPAFSNDAYIEVNSGQQHNKILRKSVNWRTIPAEVKIFALVPYDAAGSDPDNFNYVSPFEKQWQQSVEKPSSRIQIDWRFRHWLGTTKTGADVLAGLIHSTRLSLLIGFCTMLIASLLGIFIGSLAGYFGDKKLKVKRISILLSFLLIVPAWYYAFLLPAPLTNDHAEPAGNTSFPFIFRLLFFVFVISLPFWLSIGKKGKHWMQQMISIPVDTMLSRFIELFLSVPRLILIITLAALSRPSVWSIILILGCCSWTGIARLVRAEYLRLRETGFSDAASALGYKASRKILLHLLPNAMEPVRVSIIFGIAGAILTEAGLSFLGIGLSPETVTWGSLLAAGREQFSAWWLVLFPGLAISLLLIVLNRIANDRKEFIAEKIL